MVVQDSFFILSDGVIGNASGLSDGVKLPFRAALCNDIDKNQKITKFVPRAVYISNNKIVYFWSIKFS